jgi:hypothetical protein
MFLDRAYFSIAFVGKICELRVGFSLLTSSRPQAKLRYTTLQSFIAGTEQLAAFARSMCAVAQESKE